MAFTMTLCQVCFSGLCPVPAGYAAADSSELREYSHTMFGNVARALGEDFAPYLGHVVGLAFTSCRQEDGAEFVCDDSSDSDGDEDLGSDESSDDEGGGRRLNVRTGGLLCALLFLQQACI
jgi:hypothetical protein